MDRSINITPPSSPARSAAPSGDTEAIDEENVRSSGRATRSRRGKRKYDPKKASVSLTPADTKMNRKTQRALKLIDVGDIP